MSYTDMNGTVPEFRCYHPDDPARWDDIWVVEDTDEVRRFAGLVLGRDYQVKGFSDGQHAYDALMHGRRPRLLLTDTCMPKKDGLTLIKGARVIIPDLAIILMSGDEDGRLEENAEELKVPSLRKPFGYSDLKSIVQQHYQKGRP